MSGSALSYNAYHDGNHKCLMYEMARNASQPVHNTKELIAFLKTVPASQIQNFLNAVSPALPWPMPWAPVIES